MGAPPSNLSRRLADRPGGLYKTPLPMALPDPELSVVVPVKDEAGNVRPLIDEIVAALRPVARFEIVYVDDGSRDSTLDDLKAAKRDVPELRALAHRRNAGQSAALRTGVRAARGALVATLDGDGQNPPEDIPKLLAAYRASDPAENVKLVAGQRLKRQDVWSKRVASRLANGLRAWALGDATRDTGCGLKLFERQAFLDLPYFDHVHRYLPALMKREGYGVALADVGHRPRRAGASKYTNLQRALVSVRDLMGVMWLMARRRPTDGATEV